MIKEWYKSVQKINLILPYLNEKQKRILIAAEAKFLGQGAISFLSVQLGVSRNAINHGLEDLKADPKRDNPEAIRKKGGGRKSLTETQKGLTDALIAILSDSTRGDPESPLMWTSKSISKITQELNDQGFIISPMSVYRLLKEQGYSLQANAKVKEGKKTHPDRDSQFDYINESAKKFMRDHDPVISVDAKKKELIGDYNNPGKEWAPSGEPTRVLDHDFPDPKVPKAVPFGVYDIEKNIGFVSVGKSCDTAEFAVESIRTWWNTIGAESYPKSKKILICADSGGSNSSRSRLWKSELQKFCNMTRLSVTVCHFPAGTSKWNKIEHRLFSEISKNWRGRPLVSYETVVNLIGETKTKSGLKVHATLDEKTYEKGIKISDDELSTIRLQRHKFHGEWNYTIKPDKIS